MTVVKQLLINVVAILSTKMLKNTSSNSLMLFAYWLEKTMFENDDQIIMFRASER